MNEDAYVSDEEELECPLCMEEFDISDRTFKPCPCGYQICRFCYNRIVNSESANGCPACRRQYTEETVEFKPLSAEEWKKDQQRIQSRKLKEKEKRETEMASRRHLSNMRVVQKNLVYVIGFSPKSADADLAATLRGNDYFAQYGKINKIVVNKKSHPNGQPTVGVYITYARKEDAARAVQAVDGTMNDGRVLRASFGTTKYCSAYLRQQVCQNPNCMYLHEPGEDLDSYTREDMSTIQHAAKAAEGMHANALAAHHMRRLPSRADSTSTANQDDTPAVALPATASWASTSRSADNSSLENAQEHTRPDTLPPSQDSKEPQTEIPPPPSQTAQGAVHPSELLPPPVQPGFDHPILGKTIRSLFEGKFNFKLVPRVMPGLSEADIRSAESFPRLFAWNPESKRPSSPSKNGKAHNRSGSRYAFAAETRTPPPGFVPPGLATGVQPPGFHSSSQGSTKDGSTDFFSQFLRNAGSGEAGSSSQMTFEDPAIVGLRDSIKSPTTTITAPRPNTNVFTDPSFPSSLPSLTSMIGPSIALRKSPRLAAPRISPVDKKTAHRQLDLGTTSTLRFPGSPDIEKPQSKFGASFARLESLESQAQEITSMTDQKFRSSWEPTSRPRDVPAKNAMLPSSAGLSAAFNEVPAFTRSSGTWQPSPPPPKNLLSPSPVPAALTASKVGSSLRNVNKAPWEPSPPPTQNRTATELKTAQSANSVQIKKPEAPSSPKEQVRQPPVARAILADEDFPALRPTQQMETIASVAQTPPKKMWDPVPPVVAISPNPLSAGQSRRTSVQSMASGLVDKTRSRQNSNAELPGKLQTPTRGMSPVTSPSASRSASPVISPLMNRTTSAINTVPTISSPLANLNTGKQIRILSKGVDEAKLKADKAAAEELAIKKIKEEEAAAAAKSMIRKSVPATSIKKTKEQKLAEQREKAERRETDSLVSSQPEEPVQMIEVAPIVGRARKQKNKQAVNKTGASKVPERASNPDSEGEQDPDEPEPGSESITDGRMAASDAISELSKEIDLRTYKFFQPVPGLNFQYSFTTEELEKGQELAQWPTYTGKETIDQLERLLTSARKEAADSLRSFEKCQKRNIKLARLDVTTSITV